MKKSVIKTCSEQKTSENYNCLNKKQRFENVDFVHEKAPPKNISPPKKKNFRKGAYYQNFTVYKLGDVGISSNMIGSLSLANRQF